MKRKDSFFGLHFDYHANADTKNIGKELDTNVIERIVTEVKPDFIQCDTKGHPGFCSYPTKVGNPAPGLERDILKEWRAVTKKHDVMLFSHYSGIWDKKAMADHPDWASVRKDGEITDRASVFGDYAEKLLIPQLKELATEYEMDGAWVDGECWALTFDYTDNARLAWRGSDEEFDESNPEYRQFIRDGFFAYVKKYIDEVKKVNPEFELTSNWFNTAWVPDNITFTDYISGDLAPTNSVDSARFDGRIMQSFGRNWDIMSWGISFPVHYSKSAVQLCQEAAVIVSLGGGFQIYNMQSPQKTVMDEWAISEWAKVSDFVRARRPYCQHSEILPDVGVLYSKAAYYDSVNGLFYRDCAYNMELYGLITAFCDSGRSVSVILAERDISYFDYKTIVVSDLTLIEEDTKNKLLAYLRNGGEVVFCGANTAKLFAKELEIEVSDIPEQPICMIEGNGYAQEIRRPYVKAERDIYDNMIFMRECVVDGDIKCTNPPPTITPSKEKIPAFIKFSVGKGGAAVLPINIGELYYSDMTFELKAFLKECLSMMGECRVSHNKPSLADVLLTTKNGVEYIHLVNLLGNHREERSKTFDYIPRLCDIEVKYKTDKAPKNVILRPDGRSIPFDYNGGVLTVSLDVDIHTILEIEY